MGQDAIVDGDLIKLRRRRFAESSFACRQAQINRLLVGANQHGRFRIGLQRHRPISCIDLRYRSDQALEFVLGFGVIEFVEGDDRGAQQRD